MRKRYRWVLALGLVVLSSTALARDSRDGGMVCAEWRDYHYNVETGGFIEWVGEPYMKCEFDGNGPGAGSGWRGSPDGDRGPRGGDSPPCSRCASIYESCSQTALRAEGRCVTEMSKWAHNQCETYRQDRFGAHWIPVPSRCSDPERLRGCYGPPVEKCINTFLYDSSVVRHTERERATPIIDESIGIYTGRTLQVIWGRGQGLQSGCKRLARQLIDECDTARERCKGRCRR